MADITVEVDTLSLTGGGRIVSGTAGAGAGGTITITARESIMISGRSNESAEYHRHFDALGSGNAGRVLVSTPTLTIDGGFIIADTQWPWKRWRCGAEGYRHPDAHQWRSGVEQRPYRVGRERWEYHPGGRDGVGHGRKLD